jgi:hypothetical protein
MAGAASWEESAFSCNLQPQDGRLLRSATSLETLEKSSGHIFDVRLVFVGRNNVYFRI